MNTTAYFSQQHQTGSHSLSHLDNTRSLGFRSALPGSTSSWNSLEQVKHAYSLERVKESAFLRR